MSEGTVKRIGMVLAVLVLAWVVVTLTRGGPPEPGEGGGEMATFLEGLAPEAATAVVFAGGGPDAEPVRLERGPGGAAPDTGDATPTGWTVAGHAADSAQVARFLTALAEAGTGAPVSVNPANHARMEVDDASARMLVLEGPEGPDTLLVGGSGPAGGSAYARLPGRDEVHVVQADLASHAGRAVTDWRSRAMTAADTSAVTAVEVLRDGSSYRLERGDTAWTMDGEAAYEIGVENLLGELADLEAQGFPEEDDPAGAVETQPQPGAEGVEDAGAPASPAGEPDRTVTVWSADGDPVLTLRMWEPGEGGGSTLEAVATGPAARQPGTRFTLPSWRADRVAPEPGELQSG